jgi:hypothetical protein
MTGILNRTKAGLIDFHRNIRPSKLLKTKTFARIGPALRVWAARTQRAAQLAVKVAKSAFDLISRLGLIVLGGGSFVFGWTEALLSDSELLKRASEEATRRAPPSAADERTLYLVVLAVGVFLLTLGVKGVIEWWNKLPFGQRTTSE